MTDLKIGSLFSGYEGLGMAVQSVMGGDIAWVSDIDPGANKILAHRYSDVPNLGDIAAVDWSRVAPVDVMTGGFPCNDISSSGRKAGVDAGAKSGLWREFARAIGELRPGLVVVENVRDLAARGLARVAGDLADLGYDAEWTTVSACHVGAPFARVRLFLTATPAGTHGAGLKRVAEHHRVPLQDATEREALTWLHADRLAVGEKRLLDRWAGILGRPAPDPYDVGVKGQPRLTPEFVEWLMGLPTGWVTDVPDLTRAQMIHALGNGVVPQQAAAALRFLLDTEEAAA